MAVETRTEVVLSDDSDSLVVKRREASDSFPQEWVLEDTDGSQVFAGTDDLREFAHAIVALIGDA